jgi:hypothetical protein
MKRNVEETSHGLFKHICKCHYGLNAEKLEKSWFGEGISGLHLKGSGKNSAVYRGGY